MSNPVFYFEVPAENMKRAKKFYEKVFNWKITPWDSSEYMQLTTKKDGEEGIDGGMYEREDEEDDRIVCYVLVPSVNKTLKKVEDEGGTVVLDKQSMGEWGAYAIVKDTEDNFIGLHEMREMKEKKKKK
jgi:predicted enzyme related to lactoylglutathione lyase